MSHENEFNHVVSIYAALKYQLERLTAVDERVEKLETQNLDKDRLIELLSDENKRLKSKVEELEAEVECPRCGTVFDAWTRGRND